MKLMYDKDFLSFELYGDETLLVEGGHIQIARYIMETDVICLSEFKLAIEEMEEKNHNVSDFGIFGTLIFTKAG